jgi:P27 family predicted phage terminase small subunit
MPPKLVTNSEDHLQEESKEDNSSDLLFGPVPGPPEWMSFEAKLEWFRCAKDLHETGRLKGGMISLLENYCSVVGHGRELEKMLQEDGKIIGGKAHPAYKMYLDTVNNSRALASEIGFSKKLAPVVDKDDSENPWSDKSLLA